MGRHFLAPPCDEVALREEIRAHGKLASLDELDAVARRWGVDGAAMALRLHLEQLHADFLADVLSEAAAPLNGDAGLTLLVVPGLYYRERPDLGGRGEVVLEAARRCGFRAEVAPTGSLGRITANARILARELEARRGERVVVASLSIGALQVRQLLAAAKPDERPPFAGWLNLAGTPFGAHAIERLLRTPGRRLAARVLARIQGLPFATVEESLPSHSLWRAPFPELGPIEMVTVLPIPLASQVQKPLQKRFAELAPLGPTDGMVLLARSIPPGHVYPLWGSDHMVRSSLAAEAIYRILRWFRRRLAPPSGSLGDASS